MNLNELCEYTGLKKKSVYQFTHQRLIPHIKRYKKLLFEKNAIDEWIEERHYKTVK